MIYLISQFKQRDLSIDNYERRLRSKVKTLTGSNGAHPFGTSFLREVLRNEGKTMNDYDQMTDALKADYEDKALEMLMACLFMLGCNTKEPMEMYTKISDKYAHGAKDAYPVTLHKAISLYRSIYAPPKKTRQQPNNDNRNKEKENENEMKSKNESAAEDKEPEETIGAHMETEKPLHEDDIDEGFMANLFEEYKRDTGFIIGEDDDYESLDGDYSSEEGAVCSHFPISDEEEEVDNSSTTHNQTKVRSENFRNGDL